MLYQLVRFEQYAQKLETDFLHFCGFTQGTWVESIESYFLNFFFLLVYNDARSLVTFFSFIPPLITIRTHSRPRKTVDN